jgi:hypothetical protein
MKNALILLLLYFLVNSQPVFCQFLPINKVQFFKDESMLNVTIETYWSKIVKQKFNRGKLYAGRFISHLSDSTNINEHINLSVRGHFRREFCYMPPLKLSFIKTDSSVMYPLQSIKLVNACGFSSIADQFLIKEYVTYKIYNLLTEKSLRVRLLNLQYKDSSQKKKAFIKPAFLIEDIKELANRNDCKEWKGEKLNTEATNRSQMTLVAIFQYMIGNTDWSVRAMHNIKLIQPIIDSKAKPFAVPYDFDYAGLVNTDYAIPDPLLNTVSVTQRVYRGFARTMDELNEVLSLFKNQKERIFNLINSLELLTPASKIGMIKYLEEFYDTIKNPRDVQSIFIENARTLNSI